MPTRDLSHPLNDETTVYPGDPQVERAPSATHEADGYRVTEVRLGTHSGTHVDAPSHTEPDGADLDEFEVEEFAFDARLVDCSTAGAREPIGPDAIPGDSDPDSDTDPGPGLNSESDSGPDSNSDADLLVVRTGWDDHWGTDRYYDHPYLSADAAAACAERGYHVGMDALSPDPSPSARDEERATEPDGVPAHRELLGSGLFVLENLTELDGLPERFELRAYPLPLAEADGAPVRAVAAW